MKIKPRLVFVKQQRIAWLKEKIGAYASELEHLESEIKGVDIAEILRAEIAKNQALLKSLS